MPIHPREFLCDYVLPAVKLYGELRIEKHLAVNAISQVGNLAEMVALHLLPIDRAEMRRGEASQYRRSLRARWPVLGIIHDAHDSHKHGKLSRTSAQDDPKGISRGQRPESMIEYGFFVDVTFLDGPLTPYEVLAVTLNDGTKREVFELLCEALQAWEREFDQIGLT